ncbi:mRNA decapping protein [Cyclospora cayetanensis]|uniref:mRNA decapping protein n=1 Tax=Cyclospora cayetanensis TaxID=88456 RepID=A0A1D3CYN5_9EIME|nr:mRNA decapping protein [Cyclospora cayetanensis]
MESSHFIAFRSEKFPFSAVFRSSGGRSLFPRPRPPVDFFMRACACQSALRLPPRVEALSAGRVVHSAHRHLSVLSLLDATGTPDAAALSPPPTLPSLYLFLPAANRSLPPREVQHRASQPAVIHAEVSPVWGGHAEGGGGGGEGRLSSSSTLSPLTQEASWSRSPVSACSNCSRRRNKMPHSEKAVQRLSYTSTVVLEALERRHLRVHALPGQNDAHPDRDEACAAASLSARTAPTSWGKKGAQGFIRTVFQEEALALKRGSPDQALLDEALLDCYGRFFALLPESLLLDSVHLYFQVQEAWWWYIDIWVERYKERLLRLSLRDFGLLLFADCPLLQLFFPLERHDRCLNEWQVYCRQIPLRGAIILNQDLTKCLLITGWRGNRWQFPRGKMDEGETDASCASREVREEVGLDVSSLIEKQLFIRGRVGPQILKLFIIPGVREDVKLRPQKRKEIGRIQWFALEQILGLLPLQLLPPQALLLLWRKTVRREGE